MAHISLVYNGATFNHSDLFARLRESGNRLENVLFEPIDTPPYQFPKDQIPDAVLQATKGDISLLMFGNVGGATIDGLFECPTYPGLLVLMYDIRHLHPFLEKRKSSSDIKYANTYYANSTDKLNESIIGVVKFV